ncbi:MAG: hypothetical protein MJ238_07015 [Bacilli bacterium]|nr:hypothetical protein [Bacilli bacterium]
MKNMFTVKGITTTAILLALATISTIVFKLVPMGSLGLLRFSLTPAIIIFASLVLGPISGAIVGAGSDLIPAIIAPTGTILPLITLVYTVLGVVPWALEFLTRHLRKSLKKPYVLYISMALIMVGVMIPMFLTQFFEDKFGESANIGRGLAVGIIVVVSIMCCIAVTMANKRYEQDLLEKSSIPSPNEVAIIALVCELVIMCMGKGLVFTIMYSIDYEISFYTIFLGLPVNLTLSTVATYWMLAFENKYLHLREVKE